MLNQIFAESVFYFVQKDTDVTYDYNKYSFNSKFIWLCIRMEEILGG